MSVNRLAYSPEKCEGQPCCGGCDTCENRDVVEVVRCAECVNRKESAIEGFFYCDAWGKDLNASVYDPKKYFCAEGERE